MDAIDGFLTEIPFSVKTQQQYAYLLKRAMIDLGELSDLTPEQLLSWLYQHGWGAATRWQAFSAIRSYLKWKYGHDHPALKLAIKRERSGPQRALTANQAMQLINSFDISTAKGTRDLAIAGLMLDTGLRESEICRLDIKHLNLIDHMCAVLIKGQQWGWAIFGCETTGYLKNWLECRGDFCKPKVNTVFISLGGSTRGKPITPSGLRVIVRNWGEHLQIKLSPHDFRRSFCAMAIRAGAPSRLVQIAGRWSSLAMVEHYSESLQLVDFSKYSPVSYIMNR